MKPSALAGLVCAALVGAGAYFTSSSDEKPIATGSVGTAIPTLSADPRTVLKVVNVDWHRAGFGLTVVADVSVRNNSDRAVRVDRVNCRFRTSSGTIEDHAQGVYGVVQPRTQKVIRDVSLGFVSEHAKGIDCSVVGARHDL